jgi:hypothetical protein
LWIVGKKNINNNASLSTDAITWTTPLSVGIAFNDIVYGDGIFLAVGNAGAMRVSTDGIFWATRTSTFGITAIQAAAYGNDRWIAVGNTATVRQSTDTITWITVTAIAPASTFGYTFIDYKNNTWLVSGASSTFSKTSTNGVNWVTHNAPSSFIANFGDNLWLGRSLNFLYSSTNAITWVTTSTTPFSGILSIGFGENKFIAGGNVGNLSSTSSGTNDF